MFNTKIKIRRANGPWRVRVCFSILVFIFFEYLWNWGCLGHRRAEEPTPFGLPEWAGRARDARRLDFYRFFNDPKRHRKNNDFSNPQKSTKIAESIDPGAPKVCFWSKNLYFWAPFWHRFFDFFRKRRKCVISEEYNAKRGSEPSKTFDFRIVFSLNFHVFSEPPSRDHF